MERDAIFNQRREMKKNAHSVVKSHYLILTFLVLLLALFGTELRVTTIGLGKINPTTETQTEKADSPGTILNEGGSVFLTAADVIRAINAGRIAQGVVGARDLEKLFETKGDENPALGRRKGVLAVLMNGLGSGMIVAQAAQALRSVIRSDMAVGIIMTVGAFLWYLLIYMLFKTVLSAVARRLFLEARVYPKVHFLDMTHFAVIKKWVKASWTMLVNDFYLTLWMFTIVGYAIKFHSYFAVPYLVAENPNLKANQAITISRRMMDGHKMELFKFELSMIGWMLLGFATFGISELVYGGAYRIAAYTEFYAKIRQAALEEDPDLDLLLNDPYLFEKADKILLYETYFDVVDEITVLHENRITLSRAAKFVADWFGIWIGTIREKKAYDEQEGRQFAITHYKECMNQESYPQWLGPYWPNKKIAKYTDFSFIRNYTIFTLLLLFITFSFVGWSWEVILHLIQTGKFANRGTLHGPWLPIYGTGGIVVLILCSRLRKNPVAEFLTAVALCGAIEYYSGWLLETRYHQKWWSYEGYFLNLHGRICAEGLLVFGVGCCAVVYLLAPIFDYMVSKLKREVIIGSSLVLGILFAGDAIYSRAHPNMAEGAIEASESTAGETAQTEVET